MILRIGWYAAVITATVVFLVMLWQFGVALGLFLSSLAIAAALRPVIHKVSSKRLSRLAGLTLVYIVVVGSIIMGWLLIGPPLLRDLQQASNDFLIGYEHAKDIWPDAGSVFQKMLAEQLPPADEFYNFLTTPEGITALEGVFGIASGFFSLLGYLLISIVLSIYWSMDQFRFERIGLSLLPSQYHAPALRTWRAIETGVGAFIRSEVVQSTLALIVLWLGYAALNLKYPVLLAMWVALSRLIPWFGVLLAILPTFPIWIGVSPAAGFIYALFTLSVLILIRRTIWPRLIQMPDYSALPTLLLILALAEGFGWIGILLAPLLGLILRILLQELAPAARGRYSPEVARKATQLLHRLSSLRRGMPGYAASEADGLIERLHLLMRDTRDYIRGY